MDQQKDKVCGWRKTQTSGKKYTIYGVPTENNLSSYFCIFVYTYKLTIFKMDQERNVTYLDSFDLKKLVISENRHPHSQAHFHQLISPYELHLTNLFNAETLLTHIQIQCNPTVSGTQSIGITSNHKNTNTQHYTLEGGDIIIGLEVQASSLEHRGHYLQLIDASVYQECNKILVSGAAFTQMVRLKFFVKPTLNKKKSREAIEGEISKKFYQFVKEISIYGVTFNSGPSPSLLTKLLNISQKFRKFNMNHEAIQVQLLASLSLISARRFVQAAELLKKVSKFYVQKYLENRSNIDFNRTFERSRTKDGEDDMLWASNISVLNNFSTTGRILEPNKFLQKAAKVELLLAETILNPSLVIQKLSAYYRCNSYNSGNPSPSALTPDADFQEVCAKISVQIVPFFVKVLSDKLEPFRIAALKSIQFFIETLGCTIGTNLIILKQVISTYPNNSTALGSSNKTMYGNSQFLRDHSKGSLNHMHSQMDNPNAKQNQNPNKMKNKTLIDHYHHLLQTLLSILNQVNRKCLQAMLSEIIIPSLMIKDIPDELKLYLLRFVEKILSISGPDLTIQADFIGIVLGICESAPRKSKKSVNSKRKNSGNKSAARRDIQSATNNRPVLSTLIYFSHKVINLIKLKILPFMMGPKLQSILLWINKSLSFLGQNQLLSNNSQHLTFVFVTLLDFINSIYFFDPDPNRSHKFCSLKVNTSPVDPLLYFLNISIRQNEHNGIPFDMVLNTLSHVLRYLNEANQQYFPQNQMTMSYLSHEIISRILEKSKINNLSLKELKVLGKVLSVIGDRADEQLLAWFDQFLNCIPHSTYDQTYEIFTMFIKKTHRLLEKVSSTKRNQLLSKTICTLLDLYTVKGKAYQQAKQQLIETILKSQVQTYETMKICLMGNQEPKIDAYYRNSKYKKINASRKGENLKQLPDSDNQHRFDSKAFKIDQQKFIEKVAFCQMIFSKITKSEQKLITSLTFDFKLQFNINLTSIQRENHELDQQEIILKLIEALHRLSKSKILKIKAKSLHLMVNFIELMANRWSCYRTISKICQENKKITFNFDYLFICLKQIYMFYKRSILLIGKESKLMYNVLHGLALFLKQFQQMGSDKKIQGQLLEETFRKIDRKIQILFNNIDTDSQLLMNTKQSHKNLFKHSNQIIFDQQENYEIEEWHYFIEQFQIKEFLKLWSLLTPMLSSPWENVKEMYLVLFLQAYCNGIGSLCEPMKKKSMELMNPLIVGLLKSSEANQRIFGLKIFGTLLGLRVTNQRNSIDKECTQTYQTEHKSIEQIISQNLPFIKTLLPKIYELQIDDWNHTVQQISKNFCEVSLTKDKLLVIKKKIETEQKINNTSVMDNSFLTGLNFLDEIKMDGKTIHNAMITSMMGLPTHNLESLLMKQSYILEEDNSLMLGTQGETSNQNHGEVPTISEDSYRKIVDFRGLIDKEFANKSENFCEKQSFLLQTEEQFFDMIGEEKGFNENQCESLEGKDRSVSEDQQLEFQDLGIIELDDEEQDWGEEEQQDILSLNQLSHDYPSKKIYNYSHKYKLSPNVMSGSSKPQRIRSKRYYQNQYQYQWNGYNNSNKERIIVDELEEKQENFRKNNHGLMGKNEKIEDRQEPNILSNKLQMAQQFDDDEEEEDMIAQIAQMEHLPRKKEGKSKLSGSTGLIQEEEKRKRNIKSKEQQFDSLSDGKVHIQNKTHQKPKSARRNYDNGSWGHEHTPLNSTSKQIKRRSKSKRKSSVGK